MTHRAAPRLPRRCLGSVRARALLSLGVVLVVGSGGSFAYWSDSVTVSGTAITAGTIDLKVNSLDTVTGYTTMNIAAMVPGNSVAGVLTIKNAGTAPFTYYGDAAASNADGKGLGAALLVKVTGDALTTGSSPTVTCPGTPLTGTGSSFTSSLVGSSGTPRQLAAGASETICIQASLPATAASSLQGATTNVTFTFTANQLQ